ncbi:MAG TPA: 1,4-alpha-glucan branching protein GlgB [Vicinamibacterales bacterium]|nr:1,4-alpha-glucan branching protein GlgB [Vicinamibacterales bacterium]
MSTAPATLPFGAIDAIALGLHGDPFAVLGPHDATLDGRTGVIIRAFRPYAAELTIHTVRDGGVTPMTRLHPDGFFEGFLPDAAREELDYRLRATWGDGSASEFDDPYRYGPVLTGFDQHLFAEGTHVRAYDRLGARTINHGTQGVHFAVWAPTARRVSVVGDFNGWDGRVHPMRSLVAGLWEIFLPGLGVGGRYKFEVVPPNGPPMLKADPYARYFETPPQTASIVYSGAHQWSDQEWLADRRARGMRHREPLSIYEVHLGSWRRHHDGRPLSYRELAETLVPYVRDMGFTHIELLPVMEHPFGGSWGYQVIGFFAPTSRFGEPDDFKYLVDACHRAGIGVILDWVPGHFPKDLHGLARFDGTAVYEHADPRQGEHQDWGTLIFNYGRREVRSFLLSNALYWVEEFHVDGLRVDAVASMLYLDYSRKAGEWVANEFGGRENLEAIGFLHELNRRLGAEHPDVPVIAEESTAWPGVSRPVHLGGLGFTYKWNMGWMHDMLDYCKQDPVYRRYHHHKITFSMLYAFTENFILPFSHDEVVHGKGSMINKMPGDVWQKHANLRALYGYMFTHPGKKHLFMGCEIGQWREWNHDGQLDWEALGDPHHEGMQRWVRDLNAVYRAERALWEVDFEPKGFRWIDPNDHDNSVISFVRSAGERSDHAVAVVNFTPIPREGYRIGVPGAGAYRELLNSDAGIYGGSNMGNGGRVENAGNPSHGFEYSICLTLPPLGFLLLKPE